MHGRKNMHTTLDKRLRSNITDNKSKEICQDLVLSAVVKGRQEIFRSSRQVHPQDYIQSIPVLRTPRYYVPPL